jgi:hypothetical protein
MGLNVFIFKIQHQFSNEKALRDIHIHSNAGLPFNRATNL